MNGRRHSKQFECKTFDRPPGTWFLAGDGKSSWLWSNSSRKSSSIRSVSRKNCQAVDLNSTWKGLMLKILQGKGGNEMLVETCDMVTLRPWPILSGGFSPIDMKSLMFMTGTAAIELSTWLRAQVYWLCGTEYESVVWKKSGEKTWYRWKKNKLCFLCPQT